VDNLFELIQKAESGDAEAQYNVAWHIVWADENESIDTDWLERAVDYFERAIAQGHGDAMLDLGAMYRVGRGVQRDMRKAFVLYNQAAAILHPKAFRCLGYALEIPVGYQDINDNSNDYKTAFGYFFKGAILNEQNSTYKLGDMYFTGKYVEKDPQFAFNLYQESHHLIDSIEDDSYASVCLRIGECYCSGIGTTQDLDEACYYLEKAEKGFQFRLERGDSPQFFMEGYNRAKYLSKRIKANKISIVASISDENIEYMTFINSDMMNYPEPNYPIPELEKLKVENPEIEDYSFNDILAVAESGAGVAMYTIAFYCFNRYASEPDNKSIIDFALYYYHKAVQYGHKGAMYNLASIYYHGDAGIVIDRYKAYFLYLYSDVYIAQGELGIYYAKGEVVEQDYEKAFMCFAKCALSKENYCYGALENLAQMYRNGIYVEADDKFAEYLEKLSEKAEVNGTEEVYEQK